MKTKRSTIAFFGFSFLMISCSLILEDDISSEYIKVIMPIDKTVSDSSNQLFWWEAVPGADDYTLQLVKGSFALPEVLLKDTTLVNEKLTLHLNTGSYQWRLKANAQNSFSNYQYYDLEITANEK